MSLPVDMKIENTEPSLNESGESIHGFAGNSSSSHKLMNFDIQKDIVQEMPLEEH